MFNIAETLTSRNSNGLEMLEGRMMLSGDPGFGGGFFGPNPNLVATADFNGDHKADLVTATPVNTWFRGPKFTSVVVQLGRGNGLFVASSAKLIPGSASAVVTGDFNGDKNTDVGVLSTVNGQTSIQVLLGNGNGGFASPVKMDLGTMPTAHIAAGDINADGYADLVAWDNANVYVSLNDGTGVLPAAFTQSNPFGDVGVVGLGDFFGDGRYELIGVGGTGVLGNMALASTGEFMLTFAPVLDSSITLDNKRVVMADVNGDGKQDLIALGQGTVNVALQIDDPANMGHFAAWIQTTGPINPATTLVGDLNGDGSVDLFQPGFNCGFVSVAKAIMISNSDGTFHKLYF